MAPSVRARVTDVSGLEDGELAMIFSTVETVDVLFQTDEFILDFSVLGYDLGGSEMLVHGCLPSGLLGSCEETISTRTHKPFD